MKIIQRSKLLAQSPEKQIMAEIEALKRLQHPNIVQLVEVIDDPSTDKLYLVMDYLTKGTIEDQIQAMDGAGLPADKMWNWARHMVSALTYCHQ